MTKHLFFLALVAACTSEVGGDATAPQDDTSDPWPALDRQEREGPPRYTSRVHSCPKIRYRTLGNLLESRGVNVTATGSDSAGAIFAASAPVLGAPNYQQRVREHIELGLATESKIFDIFVQAAPEIIANIANEPGCSGAPLFDAQGKCQLRGISCLIGVPASQTHVDLCNLTVARAADVEHGKQLAVAVLAAAAHTCE
jgi:hypothetical protein